MAFDINNITSNYHNPESTSQEAEGLQQAYAVSSLMKKAYLVISVLGISGNFIVFVVLISSKDLRSKFTNQYILNQSVIDLLTSISMIIFSYVTYKYEGPVGLVGDLFCRLWDSRFILWALIHSSTYNLLAITFERYLGIVHTMWHKVSVTNGRVKLSLIFVWLIGPLLSAVINSAQYVQLPNGQCSYTYSTPLLKYTNLILVMFLLTYFLPVLVIAYCYVSVLRAISRKTPLSPGNSSADRERKAKMTSIQHNTIVTTLVVGLGYVTCTTPNNVITLIDLAGSPVDFSTAFYNFNVILVFTNCCLNPFIYAIRYEQFQSQFCKLFFCPFENQIST